MPATLTKDEAQRFLREHGHDARDLVPLTGGLWSAAFAFAESGREYVVRFHDRRDDLEKDRFAGRWASPWLRTPRIVEIGDFGSGGYGISERVRGTPLDDLDEPGMRRVLPSLLRALDATRDASLTGTRGYGLWHGDGNGERASWRDALLDRGDGRDRMAERRAFLATTRIGVAEFDAGLARLRELMAACPDERHLVHNDLLNFNVLVDDAGVVLLDWGASIYGDFLYDAALLVFWWPHPLYAKWSRIDLRAEVERHHRSTRPVIPHLVERLLCCQLHIGLVHIAFQAEHRMWDHAAWTARRTRELAVAA